MHLAVCSIRRLQVPLCQHGRLTLIFVSKETALNTNPTFLCCLQRVNQTSKSGSSGLPGSEPGADVGGGVGGVSRMHGFAMVAIKKAFLRESLVSLR